jgi:protease-4
VLRVDSPGGSYIASDSIRGELLRAQERKIPVVVSMGNVAASGGYFIAMDADRLIAQPGTITGSIGVVSGKLLIGGLFEKLGVSFGRIEAAPRAGMYSAFRAFTDEERQAWEQNLDRIYQDFVGKAAEARGLPRDQLEQVARGRIWTGADAKERGLVDELGGLHEAVLAAKQLAKIDATAPVTLRVYPREKEPIERLLALLGEGRRENSDDLGAPAASLDLRRAKALWRALEQVQGDVAGAPLELPPALRHPGEL